MRLHKRRGFFYHHSLTIVAVGMLGLWITFYCYSDPSIHLGSFFGNAIADWSGSVIVFRSRWAQLLVASTFLTTLLCYIGFVFLRL